MGVREMELEIHPGSGIEELRQILAAKEPNAAAALENALVSINREYAFGNERIPDSAEVAFFPHVSEDNSLLVDIDFLTSYSSIDKICDISVNQEIKRLLASH